MIKKYFYLSLLSIFIVNKLFSNKLDPKIFARRNIDAEITGEELKAIQKSYIALLLESENKNPARDMHSLQMLIEFTIFNELRAGKPGFNIETNREDALRFLKAMHSVYTDPQYSLAKTFSNLLTRIDKNINTIEKEIIAKALE